MTTLIEPPEIRKVGSSKFISGMIYAPPGAGKTTLMGQYPGRMLIIRPPIDHTDSIIGSNADEMVVDGWEAMGSAHMWLREGGYKKYDAVCLDSISLFQDIGLYDLFSAALARNPARATFGYDKQEYGLNMQRLSTWVRHMIGMERFNFFVTAHPFESENPETGESMWMPYVQGKQMSEKICGMMNFVAYYEPKTKDGKITKRVLHFNNNGRYYAKDQFDAFKNGRIVDPTMPQVMKAINAVRSRVQTTPTKTKTTKKKAGK